MSIQNPKLTSAYCVAVAATAPRKRQGLAVKCIAQGISLGEVARRRTLQISRVLPRGSRDVEVVPNLDAGRLHEPTHFGMNEFYVAHLVNLMGSAIARSNCKNQVCSPNGNLSIQNASDIPLRPARIGSRTDKRPNRTRCQHLALETKSTPRELHLLADTFRRARLATPTSYCFALDRSPLGIGTLCRNHDSCHRILFRV